MKWLAVITIMLASLCALPGASAADLYGVEVAYDIDAFLVAPKRLIDGTADVTVRNGSPSPLTELIFRLDANAGSTAISRGVGEASPDDDREAGWSGIDIYAVKGVDSHVDLATRTTIDGSRMVVSLPEPVRPWPL